MRVARIGFVLAAALLLAACPSTRIKPPDFAALPDLAVPELRGATLFRVDPALTRVHIQVFRGGALARFGHNHVMTSTDVGGRIWVHPTLARSGFDLQFPVAQLIVDDPQARTASGAEFPGEIPAADRDATRTNMLRADVLDAERHPFIRLQAAEVTGSLQQPQIVTRITIRGVARDVLVPAQVGLEGDRLTATGEFELLQTDFGIKPFSVGLGALEVQDRLRIRFAIVARRE
jgi:polyisoprenoid-binding protein YceI